MINIDYLTRDNLPGSSIAPFARAAVALAKEKFRTLKDEQVIFTAMPLIYSEDLSDAQIRITYNGIVSGDIVAECFMKVAKEYITETSISVIVILGVISEYSHYEYP